MENKILNHIINKKFTISNISDKSLVDKLKIIDSLDDDENKNKVCYFYTKLSTLEEMKMIQFGFSIPIEFDLIIMFHKGDFLYLKEIDENFEIVDEFLKTANNDIFVECPGCNLSNTILFYCNNCQYKNCKKCIFKDNGKCKKCNQLFEIK
jgi:hypothetical protein